MKEPMHTSDSKYPASKVKKAAILNDVHDINVVNIGKVQQMPDEIPASFDMKTGKVQTR